MTRQPFISAAVKAAMLGCLSLGACATAKPEAKIVPVETKVAVATSCVPKDLKDPPAYPATAAALAATSGVDEMLHLFRADQILRIQRSNEVEPVIKACR
jgi:hypothetical protein